MVIIKLWGGLGNQLFQYAYGYQLAKKTSSEIMLDISWFDKQKLRKPEILELSIRFDCIDKFILKNNTINLLNKKLTNILIRIPINPCFNINAVYYLKESRYRFSYKLKQYCNDNTYVDGYWQCPQYFDWVIGELKTMYVPCNIRPEIEEIAIMLRNTNSVAIHMRRGDYTKKKKWYSRLKILDESYYYQAFSLMEKSNNNAKYYLFSNDIKEAKKTLNSITKKEIFNINIPNLSTLEEWFLMCNCKNQIIGNSTFSWWAAYLNSYENKIIIAPNKYMGNDDIIPFSWKTINVK